MKALRCYVRLNLVIGIALLLLGIVFAALKVNQAIFMMEVSQLPTAKADGSILPNGIAAGDTTTTTTVLWTRASTTGNVTFAYSTDPALNINVLAATASVTQLLLPVKVQITGLNPATNYYYRATDSAGASAQGRFETLPVWPAYTGLRFGVSGDWGGHLAPYPAIANADERNLNFFVELGDTTYADVPSPALITPAITLNDFRLKYNEVYTTHWPALRSSTSILASIDDHEVRDDFAGGATPASNPDFASYPGTFINDTSLYQNALQAFHEYKPLRDEFYSSTGDPRTENKRKLYRYYPYGRDAAIFVLDTRSFRDAPLPLNPTNPLSVATFLTDSLTNTTRTLLGAQQLADLKANLLQAQTNGITWKFIFISGPIQNLGIFGAPDRPEGYAAERTKLLQFITQNNIQNVVFIAASLHGTIVNNLTYQTAPFGPQLSTTAFEVIAGPTAIYPPFGPATIALAEVYNLITPTQIAVYNSLNRAGKDEFVRQFVDDNLLDLPSPVPDYADYDPIGLNGSGINAALLQGGYVAVHTYGWTEFEVNRRSQVLTITTYGIDPYTETLIATNPDEVINRTPTVVSQFLVTPTRSITPVAAITINGPITGLVSTTYAFTAVVSPVTATPPITYLWQATEQTPFTQTNDLSDSITFSWAISGVKTITLSAQNGGLPVIQMHTLTITKIESNSTYLPLILKEN